MYYAEIIMELKWIIIYRVFCILSLGLSPTEVTKLNNYLHFTEPKNLKKKSILQMADLNPSIDFLDPLSDDIPKGKSFTNGGVYI